MIFVINTNSMVIVYILKIWNRWLLAMDVYLHRCRSVFHLFPQSPPPPSPHTHTFHCYLIAGGRHHLQTFYDSQSHCVIVSFADASPFFWVSLYDIEHLPQKWTVIHLYKMIRTCTYDVLAQPLWWLWCWWCWDHICGGCGCGCCGVYIVQTSELGLWTRRLVCGLKYAPLSGIGGVIILISTFVIEFLYSYSRKVRNNCGTLVESINFGKEHVARVPMRLLQPSQGSRSAVKHKGHHKTK